jgi:acetyl esterase/lipase
VSISSFTFELVLIQSAPPNADDLLEYDRARTAPHKGKKEAKGSKTSKDKKEEKEQEKEAKEERVRGYSVRSTDQPDLNAVMNNGGEEADMWISPDGKYSVGPKSMLSVQLDNETRIEIKDQIQMYAANHLLTHPLVSPALQPSLGGLPPLLIQTGGGELLRDEQIYVAHKAAQPLAYLPPPSNNQTAEEIQAQASKYKPTNVNLQVWDDLCHVGPTLSFTRPAKHMYRSIAQFGAWALARAQNKSIDIVDDDDISFISSGSSDSSDSEKPASDSSAEDAKKAKSSSAQGNSTATPVQRSRSATTVGRAGDPLPPFQHHMIRQRIDRHGRIYPLMAKEELVALNLAIADVGVPKTGPVSKWMKAQSQWNTKFSKQKIKIQKQRLKDMQKGFEGFDGEMPPPTALAGRRVKGMKAEKAKKRSWGMSMWAGWGSKHDSATVSYSLSVLLVDTNNIYRSSVKRRQISPMNKPTHQKLFSSRTNLLPTEPRMANLLPIRNEAVKRLLRRLQHLAHVRTLVTLL